MERLKLGYALCGSFCTLEKNMQMMAALSEHYDILPIMSFNTATLDTRFGKAAEFIRRAEEIAGRTVIRSIQEAEPIGPTRMTDVMLVSPCTGNTLAKLANSIVDTPVTMAVKSHLRNSKPVILAVSTNDALSGCAKNIGLLQNFRNLYFVPFRQDNHRQKQTSLVADFDLSPEAILEALAGRQLQPILLPSE